jgi:hypothetical protein
VSGRFDLSRWSPAAGQALLAGIFTSERGLGYFFCLTVEFLHGKVEFVLTHSKIQKPHNLPSNLIKCWLLTYAL